MYEFNQHNQKLITCAIIIIMITIVNLYRVPTAQNKNWEQTPVNLATRSSHTKSTVTVMDLVMEHSRQIFHNSRNEPLT